MEIQDNYDGTTFPKRPKSAWLFYTLEQRGVVIAEHAAAGKGVISMTDIVKTLGDRYKNGLSDVDRNKYTELARKDKERFQHQIEIFKQIGAKVEESPPSGYELIIPVVIYYALIRFISCLNCISL